MTWDEFVRKDLLQYEVTESVANKVEPSRQTKGTPNK